MSFGIGEAQMYLGWVDVQCECHLAGEAQLYLGGVDDQFGRHLASVKPRCIWAGLMISLGVIWHR